MQISKESLATRYRRSREHLERAYRVIPTGSQTFSKSPVQYPSLLAPHFISSGSGSHVWDIDGNEYIDLVNSLACINLGHGDRDVNAAVRDQMDSGVIFSLPHPIETIVAETLRELVPCAEMTRFGKNGSDVTAAAVRLARAHTGRDHVLVCGYHGWQDWFIGSTTRYAGVPGVVRELTHTFPYNDIAAVHGLFARYPGAVAAVMLEPMNTTSPRAGFLEELRDLTHRHGALFIFDEMITGFRYSAGGAQSLFGVIPDLATFGKAMANGYPVSAVSGKAEFMRLMDSVYFSLTYGGETLSLAAALATLTKIRQQPVISTIRQQGEKIIAGVERLLAKHAIGHILSICGHPSWSFLNFTDVAGYSQWQIKTLFLQEVLARGIFTMGLHIMSYSHSDEDVARILEVYDEVFPLLKQAVDENAMDRFLLTEPIVPYFKVR